MKPREEEKSKKMSEADKMFKKLGYKLTRDCNTYIEYSKKVDWERYEINFYKDDKTVGKVYRMESGYITMDELKAINKKVQELGWL